MYLWCGEDISPGAKSNISHRSLFPAANPWLPSEPTPPGGNHKWDHVNSLDKLVRQVYKRRMALLVRNGDIVTASERYVADILCADETITRIEPNIQPPPGAEVIDATGKYVFPGFIDPHVHIYLPCMGTFAKDTHETASQAALVGGTTTLIEMPGPDRNQEPMAGFELWLDKARGHCACDFTFHMTVSRYDDAAEKQLVEIVKRGVGSFKIYLAYNDAFGLNDQELYRTLRLAKRLGVITTAHCENADLIEELQNKLLAERKTGPEWHHDSRPPIVEAEGVNHLMTFAELLDAHVYIVHLSCKEALHAFLAARTRGVKVWAETLIQYLLLDKTHAERPDFEGAKFLMSHPCATGDTRTSCGTGCATARSARSPPTTRRLTLPPKSGWANRISLRSLTVSLRSKTG